MLYLTPDTNITFFVTDLHLLAADKLSAQSMILLSNLILASLCAYHLTKPVELRQFTSNLSSLGWEQYTTFLHFSGLDRPRICKNG